MCLLPCWLFASFGVWRNFWGCVRGCKKSNRKGKRGKKKVAECIHFRGVGCWKLKCVCVKIIRIITCVNNQKQSHGWTEMCGYCEMRYGHSRLAARRFSQSRGVPTSDQVPHISCVVSESEWVLGRRMYIYIYIYICNPCHTVGSKCAGQNQSCRRSCEHKSRDFPDP